MSSSANYYAGGTNTLLHRQGFLKAQSAWDHFFSWHTQLISRIVYDLQPSVTNLQTTLL